MTLKELLSAIGADSQNTTEVNAVLCDSRLIGKNDVFVCLVGDTVDGHNYAQMAVDRGAIAVISQKDLGLDCQVVVPDTRIAYVHLCRHLNGHPEQQLKMVGVTGTNGKSTVTSLIKQMVEFAGEKAGLIGTIEYVIDKAVLPSKHTTPEPDELYALFKIMLGAGCGYAVMETSSQALVQGRLIDLMHEVGVFTNLTQDHLDYHKDMETYFEAKKMLFDQTKTAAINIDCPYGRRLVETTTVPTITFSCVTEADLYADNICYNVSGVTFDIHYKGETLPCVFNMPGSFSVSNALACTAACLQLGLPLAFICENLPRLKGPSGRVEVLYSGDFTVICDYAHSPDSMDNVLGTIRPFTKGRLICMFGCAGRRDPSKRAPMAAVAAKWSDFVIITSDNPRDEDPYVVAADAAKGLEGTNVPFYVEPDRYFAINWAIENAQKDDVIVLCAKGHEDYQTMYPFSLYMDEHEVVRNAVKRLGLK